MKYLALSLLLIFAGGCTQQQLDNLSEGFDQLKLATALSAEHVNQKVDQAADQVNAALDLVKVGLLGFGVIGGAGYAGKKVVDRKVKKQTERNM